ncbi:N-acetylglucosamine-6-phosphate deacetylase [Planctobacterium marinum]|uniref:N-acetylglucosamine-6-phosphate deacetylase n=1 Tax=Planctobacterium marinum TaxID=1631968 RepID=UPI001E4A5BD1|nr:N-acetylglucosamine-6-phosphate deacetylase [Planctobacterium marinum]MCC2606069.1 N-acetylglucosamine-6-phosphate deacetylase [Planctobacterium marinum]
MTDRQFTVDNALTDSGWIQQPLVSISAGKIVAIEPAQQKQAEHFTGTLLPGLFDLQVNGGGGQLLNLSPTLQTIEQMVAAHRQFGTTAMLPTLITDQYSVMQSSADAVAEALDSGLEEVLGVHFEGPFLNQKKKGVHPEHFIRSISDRELTLFCRKDLGKVLVTLAPDNVSADVIKDLVGQGIHVCLGHSNATYEQTCAALEAGATGFTHIYNAMSPLQSRAPGMVGAALADKSSFAGLVLDHYHVHPAASRFAIDCKGIDKVFLVTDAMAHVGSQSDELPYFDSVIRRQNNKLTTPDGTLAGSCLDMWQAVLNAHRDLGLSLQDAVIMAAKTPASYLGLDNVVGSIKPGNRADFILINQDLAIDKVFVAGDIRYNGAGA